MSAPLASRTFTTSSRPLLMAQWSAVRPLCRWRPGVSAQRGRQRPNGLGATYTVARIHLCPCVEQRLDTTLATFTRRPDKRRIAELARNRLSVHWSTCLMQWPAYLVLCANGSPVADEHVDNGLEAILGCTHQRGCALLVLRVHFRTREYQLLYDVFEASVTGQHQRRKPTLRRPRTRTPELSAAT